MFTKKDLDNIQGRGINQKQVEKQIENFKKGFPFANIIKPATINNGILKIPDENISDLIKTFDNFCSKHRITKFVPASGAASRMFKELFSFVSSKQDLNDNEFVSTFYNKLEQFAFYKELKEILDQNNIKITDQNIKKIIDFLLTEKGLNYGNLPKGLLSFHKYKNSIKTAFEEHLVEGVKYVKGSNDIVKIIFTVSNEHLILFKSLLNKIKAKYEKEYNVKYNIEFTEQLPSTDIIAVNTDNSIYRDCKGNLLFRPGGHGALIENLNKIESDIIFIKNIDNVVHYKYIDDTVLYKKIIAALLIIKRNIVFNYLKLLDSGDIHKLAEIKQFINNELFVIFPDSLSLTTNEQVNLYKNILNRPIRVCGMVKNQGEPGGGPFWVKNNKSITQLQIVENSEINTSDKEKNEIIKNATHFNPVDIVCSTKDYKGNKFNLSNFVNDNAGFISEKSIDGRTIKAQELPGLWNGAMANWNTIFVEVPITTFNPVKTVNDLLRESHQD